MLGQSDIKHITLPIKTTTVVWKVSSYNIISITGHYMELAAILATCIMSASILISPDITYLYTVNVNIPMVFMEIKQSPTSNLFYGYIVKTDVIHGGRGVWYLLPLSTIFQ